MPEPSIADAVLDRVVAQIADEVRARLGAGDWVGALVPHRDAHGLAATGADGAAVDLAAARAARRMR